MLSVSYFLSVLSFQFSLPGLSLSTGVVRVCDCDGVRDALRRRRVSARSIHRRIVALKTGDGDGGVRSVDGSASSDPLPIRRPLSDGECRFARALAWAAPRGTSSCRG